MMEIVSAAALWCIEQELTEFIFSTWKGNQNSWESSISNHAYDRLE